MSFGLYLLGYVIFVIGMVYCATLLHVPSHWIVALVLLLAGLGIVKAVQATRPRDSA